jgi:hypothetical protein
MQRRAFRSSGSLPSRTEDSHTAFLHHGVDSTISSLPPEGADAVFVDFFELLRSLRARLLTTPVRFDSPSDSAVEGEYALILPPHSYWPPLFHVSL